MTERNSDEGKQSEREVSIGGPSIAAAEGQAGKQPPLATPQPPRDWVLQDLVMLVNAASVGEKSLPGLIGVTLFCGGSIVTGKLISHRRYFELYAAGWRASIEGADKAVAGTLEKRWLDVAEEMKADARSGNSAPPEFIHIEEPKLISGSGLANFKFGNAWRGRISEVSGWFLGYATSTERG